MKFLSKKVFFVLISVILILPMTAQASGSDQSSKTFDEEAVIKQRGEELNQFMEDFNGKKIRLKTLENHLNDSIPFSDKSIKEKSEEINSLKKEILYIEENIENLVGLVKVDTEEMGFVTPLASNDGTVSFSGTMYYDSLF